MPFRTKPLLEGWVAEFAASGRGVGGAIRVIDQDGSDGSDTGLITVMLDDASTVIYLQPSAPRDPAWIVTFEGREEAFSLAPEGVARMSAGLRLVADLGDFLQTKSSDYLEAHPS